MILAQKWMYMEQNREPEINPHTCGQLILNRGGMDIQWKKTISLASGAGKVGQPHAHE